MNKGAKLFNCRIRSTKEVVKRFRVPTVNYALTSNKMESNENIRISKESM